MLLATDLAEVLVQEGVPFREAHEVIGKLVRHCLDTDCDPRTLGLEALRGFHPAFPSAASELIGLERSVEARDGTGGTSRRRVEAALDDAANRLGMEERSA